MNKDRIITIILITIIIILTGYIIYEKLNPKWEYYGEKEVTEAKIIDEIKLPYVSILLGDNGSAYLRPINKNEIEKLDKKNLKERLTTLYENANYYEVLINKKKLKGYKISLSNDVDKIRKIETKDNIYIVLIKNNNTIGLFDYEEYYNLMNIEAIDNYNEYDDISDVKNNKLIKLDGSNEKLRTK